MAPADRVRMAIAPSTEIVFSSARLPLMLKPPLVSDEKPALLKLPPMTPAFRAGTPIGLRPENESSSMSLASTVFRRATSVCIGVACATTVTVSARLPASSMNSTLMAAPPSSTTPVRLAFLNPSSSAPTS